MRFPKNNFYKTPIYHHSCLEYSPTTSMTKPTTNRHDSLKDTTKPNKLDKVFEIVKEKKTTQTTHKIYELY